MTDPVSTAGDTENEMRDFARRLFAGDPENETPMEVAMRAAAADKDADR